MTGINPFMQSGDYYQHRFQVTHTLSGKTWYLYEKEVMALADRIHPSNRDLYKTVGVKYLCVDGIVSVWGGHGEYNSSPQPMFCLKDDVVVDAEGNTIIQTPHCTLDDRHLDSDYQIEFDPTIVF